MALGIEARSSGSNARTLTRLDLRRSGTTSAWDTDPATIYWALGASAEAQERKEGLPLESAAAGVQHAQQHVPY